MATATLAAIDDEPHYEVIDGVRVEVPHLGAWAGSVATWLATWLNVAGLQADRGRTVTEILVRLKPGGNQRRPDVVFIPIDRWTPEMTDPIDIPVYDVVPSIAVEVNSPSNTAAELKKKVREYLQAGVAVVWVVYPDDCEVHVFDSPRGSTILRSGDTLRAGDVLPEFEMTINSLFSMGRQN